MSDNQGATVPDMVVIDGPHRGDLRADMVQVEREGTVLGNVTARVVRLAGRIWGDVEAVEFYAAKTAFLRGSVRAEAIGIMPGAYLSASFESLRQDPRAMPAAAPLAVAAVEERASPAVAEPILAAADVPAPQQTPREMVERALAEISARAPAGPGLPAQDAAEAIVADEVPEPAQAPVLRPLPKLF